MADQRGISMLKDSLYYVPRRSVMRTFHELLPVVGPKLTEIIDAGCEALTAVKGEFWPFLVKESVDVMDPKVCPLGQVFKGEHRPYLFGLSVLGLEAGGEEFFGFAYPPFGQICSDLTNEEHIEHAYTVKHMLDTMWNKRITRLRKQLTPRYNEAIEILEDNIRD